MYSNYTQMKSYSLLLLFFLISSYSQAQSDNMNTTKYGLIASLKAKEGKTKELSIILLKASDIVSKSEGCISYIVSLDSNDPTLIWIIEVWVNKTNHDESLKNPEVRALIGNAMPLLDGPPQKGKELKVLGGLGSH